MTPQGAIQRGYKVPVGRGGWQSEFVQFIGLRWRCTCRDYAFAARCYQFSCAHIDAVLALLAATQQEVA